VGSFFRTVMEERGNGLAGVQHDASGWAADRDQGTQHVDLSFGGRSRFVNGLILVRYCGGEIHQVGHCRVGTASGFGDDRTAVGVPTQQYRRRQPIKDAAYLRGVCSGLLPILGKSGT
jgi:hypothetical protein